MRLADEFLTFTAEAEVAEKDPVNQLKPGYRFVVFCGKHSKAIFFSLCATFVAAAIMVAIWLR